jgi:signal transduction histidine kinase
VTSTPRPSAVVGLSPAQLVDVFPFHFVFDETLSIVQVGRSVADLLPLARVGLRVDEVLVPRRPAVPFVYETVVSSGELLYVMESKDGAIVMRGQMLRLSESPPRIAFLCTPWLDGPDALDRMGLTLGDFALHDVSQELAQLVQTHRIANDDLRQLAELLTSQRTELRRINAELVAQNEALTRATLELERMTGQRDMILDLSPDALLAFDDAGRHVYSNPKAAALLGLPRAHLNTLTEAKLDALLAERCSRPEGLAQSWEVADGPPDIVRCDHPRIVFRRSVRSVRSNGGRIQGRVIGLQDVTHEIDLERVRSEFFATAAHELRTPMSSIHGFSELLMSRELDAETTREVVETIHSQSHLVVRIVNDLLDLERIASGNSVRDIAIAELSLDGFVPRVLDSLMVEGDPRRAEIGVGFGVGASVLADEGMLRRALLNVLSNAFKYSRAKGGAVVVGLVRREHAGRPEIGIEVRDSGIGMTPDQVGHVFDRFYRADPDNLVPGTGLGMTLVREIAERMDGSVQIESALGEGTVVTLWLREVLPAISR